jgi:hypothetical protein
MKVLCKKTMLMIFSKDKYYNVRIIEKYDANDIYCYEIENDYKLTTFLYEQNNRTYYPGNLMFSEYFYTEQELRKVKLNKLNKNF